jgi:hypothetical protein
LSAHFRCGHEYTEANTITRSDGSRICRTCKRARNRRAERRGQELKAAGTISLERSGTHMADMQRAGRRVDR